MLAAAAELGLPLIVHPYYVGPRPGLAEFYLTNLLVNPVETVGADRVVFGTDYPFDMAAGPLHDQVEGTGLSDADIAAIAGGNANRLFRLQI